MADQVTYGGQAVIEGVMMRGPKHFAVACRKPDGEILVQREKVPAFFTRYAWARWPFLRGVFALADSLVLGMKSLLFSANLAMEEQQKAEKQETEEARRELDGDLSPDNPQPGAAEPPHPPGAGPLTQALLGPLHLMLHTTAGAGGGSVSSIAVTGSAVAGMAIGIALFMLFPSLVAGWLTPFLGETIWRSVVEGAVRVALVLGYIASIGRMKEVERIFRYHGAEHQAINAWEKEGVVSVDAAMRASRIHPRCGTNFVLTVLLVKALVFTVLPWQNVWYLRLGMRLIMLPVVASVSYEIIRLAGRYRNVAPLQWLVAPGLMTQYLTTREPDIGHVEVAVASLRGVMEQEAAAAEDSRAVPAIA